jgi:hypothetical protein
MVEVAHAAGKPALLHSCGNLEAVMAEVITSLPTGSSSAATAMWTAAVPLLQAIQCFIPYISANRVSKARTFVPM